MENVCGESLCHMSDSVKGFVRSLQNTNYTKSTVKSYSESVTRFSRFLEHEGIVRFQDVDTETIEKYRLRMFTEHLSESSVDHYLRCIKALFRYLENQGELFENPFSDIEMHRPSRKLPRVLSQTEIKQLMGAPDCSAHTGIRDRAILEVLYGTGIRKSELLNLKVFDVDIDTQTLRVLGKWRKERVLPIGKHAAEYVKLYLKNARPNLVKRYDPDVQWLFLSVRSGKGCTARPNLDTHFFSKYRDIAGIKKPVSCHTLRRSCATHMLSNGAHPLMVAEMLGHSSLRNLSQYLQVSITELINSHGQCKVGG